MHRSFHIVVGPDDILKRFPEFIAYAPFSKAPGQSRHYPSPFLEG
jgi:hypothetical protein